MSTTRRQPPKVPRPDPIRRALSPRIADLAADPSAGAVEEFWSTAAFPIVEPAPADAPAGTVLVTFCWRDADAEQVLLFANRITDETRLGESLLARVPGTDVWHVGYVMEADWRASYCFLVRGPGQPAPWLADGDQVAIRAALDRGRRDPGNPLACRNRAGVVQSVVALPQAPPQPWLDRRADVERGVVVEEVGALGRTLLTYEAPGVGDGSPLVVVLDGEVWTSVHDLPGTLDNLVADGVVPPVRAVFLPSGGRDARWAEMGGVGGDTTATYVADHLLPALDHRGWLPEPGRVAVAGQSLGGLTCLRLALTRPDLVGVALSQSASLWLDDLGAEVADGPRPGPRIHLAHGRQEWVLVPPHRDLARRLRGAGVPVSVVEHNGGHDYAWWRGAVADAIAWAFG